MTRELVRVDVYLPKESGLSIRFFIVMESKRTLLVALNTSPRRRGLSLSVMAKLFAKPASREKYLDEPTNDLDRDGRQAILQFLRERENGVLLISHDRECLDLCEEVRELSDRGLSKFGGGWLAYTEARELALGKIDPAHHAAEHSLFR